MIEKYDGRKNPSRRALLESDAVFLPEYKEYRKKTTIFARKEPEEFEVLTLEGLHTGKAGDYLAVGIHGEMYPIDATVFEDSYEEKE